MMRDLTLGFLSIGGLSATQLVETAAAAGYQSVGIRLTGRRFGDNQPDIVGNRQAMADLKAALHDNGIRLSNVSTYHLYPDVTVEDMAPVVDAAAELGCDTIVAVSYETAQAPLAGLLARYAERAAAFGVRLSIEFQPYSGIRTLAEADSLVTLAGQPNLGLMIDPLHLARSGGSPADLKAIAPERLHFAQICDAPAQKPDGVDLLTEARNGRLYMGDGGLPLREFIAALPPDIEFECESPVVADAGLPALERARLIRQRTLDYLLDKAA